MSNQQSTPAQRQTQAPLFDDSAPRWLVVLTVTVIITVAVLLSYTIYADNQARMTARENACSVEYERYSDEWQRCIDDR